MEFLVRPEFVNENTQEENICCQDSVSRNPTP